MISHTERDVVFNQELVKTKFPFVTLCLKRSSCSFPSPFFPSVKQKSLNPPGVATCLEVFKWFVISYFPPAEMENSLAQRLHLMYESPFSEYASLLFSLKQKGFTFLFRRVHRYIYRFYVWIT